MKLFAILALGVILSCSAAVICFGSSIGINHDNDIVHSSLSNAVKAGGFENNTDPNRNSPSFSSNSNESKGLLSVKITVNNERIGNKKPSDFTINIHANDPSIASFPGSSSGTEIKLGMGMYSVSESRIPGYISSFSPDCFGGIMSVETRNCVITNTYDRNLFPSK
jgi:hypothetical protein